MTPDRSFQVVQKQIIGLWLDGSAACGLRALPATPAQLFLGPHSVVFFLLIYFFNLTLFYSAPITPNDMTFLVSANLLSNKRDCDSDLCEQKAAVPHH